MVATESPEKLSLEELRDIWPVLSPDERAEGFRLLDAEDAEEFIHSLSGYGQASVIRNLPPRDRRRWMRALAPDDATDVLQEVEPDERRALLGLLDEPVRREVAALLAYAEDDAGGLMNPRFVRVRPDMTIDEAIAYLRRQARANLATIYYVYVLDASQRLLGVASLREIFSAPPDKQIRDVMETDLITVLEDMDQESVARLIAREDLAAVPVVDTEGRMKGIVTVDDIVDVVLEEATEDIQKGAGMEALDVPYMQTRLGPLIRKRAGWLSILFVGEMLTTTAMGRFEGEIARAVVLALFVPLIISSGGNSGSQASTLVIRAMALGEVRLRDWWRVVRREMVSGLALGAILAALGFVRVVGGEAIFANYGEHYVLIALTVAISLLGVVMWGTLSGSMLPFILRGLGFDPASASAPFVATLVDVLGVVIYFSAASYFLGGTLL